MIFINFVLAAAALDKLNSAKGLLPKVPLMRPAAASAAGFDETTITDSF